MSVPGALRFAPPAPRSDTGKQSHRGGAGRASRDRGGKRSSYWDPAHQDVNQIVFALRLDVAVALFLAGEEEVSEPEDGQDWTTRRRGTRLSDRPRVCMEEELRPGARRLRQLDEERAAIRIQAAWGLFRLERINREIAQIDRQQRIIDAQLAAIAARRAQVDAQLEPPQLAPGTGVVRPSSSSSSSQ